MTVEPLPGDAFGQAVLAYQETGEGGYALERDDGWLRVSSAGVYFREASEWPEGEAALLDRVGGRAIDIGAGAGRYALELQRRGIEVTALDASPGAAEVCRRRGLAQVICGRLVDLPGDARFDTLLLGGHNFGLLESPEAAPAFLARLHRHLRPGGRVVGTARDPAEVSDPDMTAYRDLNRSRGRPPGQLCLRVRYLRLATPWFDYWYLGPDELRAVAEPSGWRLVEATPIGGGTYAAVLEAG